MASKCYNGEAAAVVVQRTEVLLFSHTVTTQTLTCCVSTFSIDGLVPLPATTSKQTFLEQGLLASVHSSWVREAQLSVPAEFVRPQHGHGGRPSAKASFLEHRLRGWHLDGHNKEYGYKSCLLRNAPVRAFVGNW